MLTPEAIACAERCLKALDDRIEKEERLLRALACARERITAKLAQHYAQQRAPHQSNCLH